MGSSPLARGLLCRKDLVPGAQGIIPARAGFTTRSPRSGAGAPDHPRSRGVYARYFIAVDDDEGSSPLARGLRRYCGRVVLCYRIIPARAGFTTLSRRIPGSCSDHPRSRGVYFSCAWGMILPARIIPARAGFTPHGASRSRVRGDHPRSRGVYRVYAREGVWRGGSSPLARGLRFLAGLVAGPARIIPARAGFTGV